MREERLGASYLFLVMSPALLAGVVVAGEVETPGPTSASSFASCEAHQATHFTIPTDTSQIHQRYLWSITFRDSYVLSRDSYFPSPYCPEYAGKKSTGIVSLRAWLQQQYHLYIVYWYPTCDISRSYIMCETFTEHQSP
jgi:hypothetical protein